jgi:V/A-type H+-transporting ATPase subunit I
MAIEKLKKLHIVCFKEEKEKIVDELYRLHLFHIDKIDTNIINGGEKYFKHSISTSTVSSHITQINMILSYFDQLGLNEKGLIASFLPEDEKFTKKEFNDIINNFNLNTFYVKTTNLFNKYSELQEKENLLNQEKKLLISLQEFPFEFALLKGTEKTESIFALINTKDFAKMISSNRELFERNAFYQFGKKGSKVYFVIVYLKEDKDLIRNAIKGYKIEQLQVPSSFSGFVEDEAGRIESELKAITKEKQIIYSKFVEFNRERGKLYALLDYYKSMEDRFKRSGNAIEGRDTVVIRGFVRASDVPKLSKLEEKFNATFIYSDPEHYDAVPISLNNAPFFRPFEMLIKMFGLPSYFTLDPTPIVTILFSLFFGIALGDAFYGLLLVLGSLFFLHKYRGNRGVENFFSVFLYAGSVTIIVGLLTGSVGGNFFPTYFPNSQITHFLMSLRILDPESADGSIKFLTFAISLGILVQLFGIVLNIIINFRNKLYAEAIFNGFGWLFFIPGSILIFFIGQYPQLKFITYGLLIIGTILLLAGGWISIRQPLFKPIAALVNIYGIRSSYGITAFLGDALSYSRLFVLGLSTSILASSFNLVSKLIGSLFGTIGIFILLFLLLFGHALTFLMNSLGAFIHSIRLNFLEFFGRFYDMGSGEFQPIGLEFKNIRIISKNEGGRN